MDLTPQEKTSQEPPVHMLVDHYIVEVRSRLFPWLSKKHKCYRHEVFPDTSHLVLYRTDRTQIAVPIAKRSWVVYANYWDFMKQLNK